MDYTTWLHTEWFTWIDNLEHRFPYDYTNGGSHMVDNDDNSVEIEIQNTLEREFPDLMKEPKPIVFIGE